MSKRKILLVEDIYINQLMVETFLVDSGFEVKIADDGEKAIEAINIEEPDLVILDLMMPIMDGFSFLEYLKGKYTFPVIVVSARSDFDSIEKAIKLGAVDYLIKPFNPTDLINKVERLCAV